MNVLTKLAEWLRKHQDRVEQKHISVDSVMSGVSKSLDRLRQVQQYHLTLAQKESQAAADAAARAVKHRDEMGRAEAVHTNLSKLLEVPK